MADTTELDQMYRDLDEADKAGESELGRRIMTKIRAAKGQQIGAAPSVVSKSFLDNPVQYLGETAADIATKFGGLGGALNKPLALVGALGSYTQPGDGSFNDRYMREMRGLTGRQQEASTRSPMTTPAAEIAGYTVLPLSKAMGAPMTEAASVLPKTLPGAAGRVAAGYGDLARFKLLGEDGSLPDANASSMLASTLGPGMKELGPALNARAAIAETKANLHRASAAGIRASDQPVVEDKLLGTTAYNPSRGRESVGELAAPFVKPGENTGQIAGRMGAANEEAKRVMEAARAAAEPTARVNHAEVISEMETLRDRLFSKADLTVPERESALRKVNDIIERVRNHFSPKVVGVMQQGVAAGPTTPETTYGPPARSVPKQSVVGSLAPQPGPVVHPSAVGESNLIPTLDNRLIPGTNRPQPNTGWTPVVEEVPLSKFSELKSLWQGIAGSKPSGGPRTSAEIETKPVLEFFEGGGGILRRAEENAIAKVLPQEQAQAFNAAKRAYGVTETLLPMTQASSRTQEPMTMLGQARHSWSPYHFGTRYLVGKVLPQESTIAAYQSGKADKMNYLSDVMGPAAENPNYLAAIMAEILRKKAEENR
jgi:hypothetical protein